MTRLIIKEYCADWRERLRSVLGGMKWFPYVYAVFLCPVLMSPVDSTDVWYYIEMGTLMLCFVIMRMFPLHLCKTMFLCPLDGEQRLEYLKKAYRLKVWFCVGICAAANAAVVAGGMVTAGMAAVLFFFQAILAPALGLYMDEAFQYGRYQTWIKTNLVGYAFCMTMAGMGGVMNVLVWLVWGVTGEIAQFTVFGRILLLLMALFQIFMTLLCVCRYRKRVLAAAADYVNTYLVWDEKE